MSSPRKSPLLVHGPLNALVGPDVDLVLAVQANAEAIDGGAGVDRASVQQRVVSTHPPAGARGTPRPAL